MSFEVQAKHYHLALERIAITPIWGLDDLQQIAREALKKLPYENCPRIGGHLIEGCCCETNTCDG